MKNWRHIGLVLLLAASSAGASPYGCEVLLCLSNPASNGGPMGVAECVDPVSRLYRDLRKGRSFPRCEEAGSDAGRSEARQVIDAYDPCPNALNPAADGTVVAQGRRDVSRPSRLVLTGPARLSPRTGDGGTSAARACVGEPLGWIREGVADSPVVVGIYARVVWQQAQRPRAIDVFVDGQWRQRVHW